MLEILTSKDVCNLIRISRQTLRTWIKKGIFPKPLILNTKKLLWNKEVIEKWIKNN